MDIDGKLVILRGPAGKLASPDAPNTGTWADLKKPDGSPAGWRGVKWLDAHSTDPATHHRATKQASGDYVYTSLAHNGPVGADATKHSGDIGSQFYYMPDGGAPGPYETWPTYEGTRNGAVLAMVDYGNDEGRYFACGLAVEVVG